ncbi:MAG: glycosyltransferase [Candidatus Aenigmarchaeota archaeon]|nr:glycosyltransferase [Candidatus Aenigmarchaeota archaeon]
MLYLLFMFFVLFIGVYLVAWFLLVALSGKDSMHQRPAWVRKPTVSILVPARNEERNITKSLESLSTLDYPKDKLDVIVIDNGSTDGTRKLAEDFRARHAGSLKVRVLSVPEPGKGKALNEAMKHATGEIVGIFDADTFATPGCLSAMVPYFKDASVGAVTNYVKPSSTKGLLASLQGIEYTFASFTKKVMSMLNSVYIVPGTLSLLRKDVIRSIGFSDDTLTEDMDAALCMLKAGYVIENSMDAVTYTVVPASLAALLKQRIRWYRGYFENVIKHSDIMFNKKYPHLGMFVLPFSNTLAVFVGVSLTLVFMSNLLNTVILYARRFFNLPLAGALDIISASLHTFSLGSLFMSPYSTITYALIAASSIAAVIVSFRMQNIRVRDTILIMPLYFFAYYTLMMVFWTAAIVLELVNFRKRW